MNPEQIRESYNKQVEKIRARQDLTDQAKQVAMARAHTAAVEKIEAVRQADQQQYQTRRTQLEKRLFGNRDLSGMEALSARDAREKAAQLTDPQAAQAAYSRALRDGDRDYARAIAAHAADQASVPLFGEAWVPVVETHAESTPGYSANLQEFRSLREPGTYEDTNYMTPDVPSELGRLTTHQVTTLANSELTVYGNDAPEAA